jgi:hypothetical protein
LNWGWMIIGNNSDVNNIYFVKVEIDGHWKQIHMKLLKTKGRVCNVPAFFIIHISIRNHCVSIIYLIADK